MSNTTINLLVFLAVLLAILLKELEPLGVLSSAAVSVRFVGITHIMRHNKLLFRVEPKFSLELRNIIFLQRRAVHTGLALVQRAETDRGLHAN